MVAAGKTVVVIADANVLINLFHIEQLPLLGALQGHRFLVPEEVVQEILDPGQRKAVIAAISAGHVEQVPVETMEALTLFAELRDVMGRGEAACLALATTMACRIASDGKKRFRRRAVELIGEGRILRTESLLLDAIRQGHITVDQANGFKATLAVNRYSMSFTSFADLL